MCNMINEFNYSFMAFMAITMLFLIVLLLVIFSYVRKVLEEIKSLKVKVSEHYSYIQPILPNFRMKPSTISDVSQISGDPDPGSRPKLVPRIVSCVSFAGCDEEVRNIFEKGTGNEKSRKSRVYLTPVMYQTARNGISDALNKNVISELKNSFKHQNKNHDDELPLLDTQYQHSLNSHF